MMVEGREHVTQFASDSMISLIAYDGGGISLYMPSETFGQCVTESTWLAMPSEPGDSIAMEVGTAGVHDTTACTARWSCTCVRRDTLLVAGERREALLLVGAFTISSDDGRSVLHRREYRTWYSSKIRYVLRERIREEVQVDTILQLIGETERTLDAIHEVEAQNE
jgi:hypothetical protein